MEHTAMASLARPLIVNLWIDGSLSSMLLTTGMMHVYSLHHKNPQTHWTVFVLHLFIPGDGKRTDRTITCFTAWYEQIFVSCGPIMLSQKVTPFILPRKEHELKYLFVFVQFYFYCNMYLYIKHCYIIFEGYLIETLIMTVMHFYERLWEAQ